MKAYRYNYALKPSVFVNGNINEIEFQRIQLADTEIIAFLKITENVSVTFDGFK